jgi:anti-anti-sigma regulatory factor
VTVRATGQARALGTALAGRGVVEWSDDDPPGPERLAISDAEVRRRLEFLGFTEEDAARLRAQLPALGPHLGEVACALYDHAARVPHLRQVIEGHVVQCRTKQAAYLRQLLEARVDAVYAASRAWVGEVHLRAGLEPRWYLAAFSTLQELLNERLTAVPALQADPGEGWRVARSLSKLVFFDLILALDAYVDGLVGALRAREAVLRELSTPVALEVLPGLFVVPVVGRLDDAAAHALWGALLQVLGHANAVVVDLSRLAVPDEATCSHVFRLARDAARVGPVVLVGGVSRALQGELARAGVDLRGVTCRARLVEAVQQARRVLRERAGRTAARRRSPSEEVPS